MNPSDGRLTDVPGVAVGHWTDPVARTGCTVIVVPEGTVAAGEVRGGGPASREMALLELGRNVSTIDAVVLTGGSAFGLAAADGVMAHLEQAGRGYATPAGRVPIVPTLGLYDLAVGDSSVRPDAAAGRAAAASAGTDGHEVGQVGAGTGCTTGKIAGLDQARPGGIVAASVRVGSEVVACLVAVNAVGTVGAPASMEGPGMARPLLGRVDPGTNTTIGVVATSAPLDRTGCHLLASAAHHGLARAVFPSHTRFDGDAFVAFATGAARDVDAADGVADGEVSIDELRMAATVVVQEAILSLADRVER